MFVPKFRSTRLVVSRIFCSLLLLQTAAASAAQTPTAQTLTAQTDTAQATAAEPAALVYPFLDTANSRWFYFSSAARPFGMVSLFPDTALNGEWGSGYRYDETTVKGFNHIHEWQLAGLSLMPVSDHRPLSAQQRRLCISFFP